MTETTKLDVYIHYNFNSLVAENIGEITPRWANGGGSTPSACLKNHKDLVQDFINSRDNQSDLALAFRKKIKII